jgi:hypothetical protein
MDNEDDNSSNGSDSTYKEKKAKVMDDNAKKTVPRKRNIDTTKLQVQRNPGETDEEFNKRRQKVYNTNRTIKEKKVKVETQAKCIAALKVAAATQTDPSCVDDFFVKKVVGVRNFLKTQAERKYESCKIELSLRLNIDELLEMKTGVQEEKTPKKKRGKKDDVGDGAINVVEANDPRHVIISRNEWIVSFFVDVSKDVGEEKTKPTKEEVKKLPKVKWLHVKDSTIPNAGKGVFALRQFLKGAIIGLYMGGEVGHEDYTMEAAWAKEKRIRCYPFTDSRSMGGRSSMTMGMQMINDPNYDGIKTGKRVNAKVMSDLFVVALKNIKVGEEIFIAYNLKDN